MSSGNAGAYGAALIGNGFVAKRHIEAIEATGGRLLMVADIDPSREVEGVPFYSDYRFLTADPSWDDVNCVVICTPNDLHVPMAKWATEHGKVVLCEKPLAMSFDELLEIEDNDSIFTVLQLRHHPIMEVLKGLKPERVSLHVKVKRGREFWEGWQGDASRSGGILNILGIHYFDALMRMFGEEVTGHACKGNEAEMEGYVRLAGFDRPIPFYIGIDDTDLEQDRYILADGKKYRFSNKDNLSLEGLHINVYRDLVKGEGVRPRDLLPVTKLIDDLRHV